MIKYLKVIKGLKRRYVIIIFFIIYICGREIDIIILYCIIFFNFRDEF